MKQKLTLVMVKARSPELQPFSEMFGSVTFCCERGGPNAIYMELRRPSFRNGVAPPPHTPGMKITLMPGGLVSKRVIAEFCGPKIDEYLEQIRAEGDNHAGVMRVLAPLLQGELSAVRLT